MSRLSFPSVFFLLFTISACQRPGPESALTPDLVTRNNAAVGLMGQFDFNAAVTAFDALQVAAPDWPTARFNLAVALMNRQEPSDASRAEGLLRELLKVATLARRSRYVLGLLLVHDGREAEALPLLTDVAGGSPPDGFAAYFIGQLRLTEAPAEALEWHKRATAQQPLLRNAYYGAFIALRRLNREEDAATMLSRFQELEPNPQAIVAEFKYTRMGPLAEAITVDMPNARPAAAPSGASFLPPVPLTTDASISWRRGGPPRSITVADINGDGTLDVFIANAMDGAAPNAVLLGRGNGFALDRANPLASIADVHAALWGDLDDDGLLDVVLCRPSGGTEIWKQSSEAHWVDITKATGVRLPKTDIVDGAVFDADHDGDLDIWLVNAAGPNELLNNDGGGHFRAIGGTAGIAGDGRPSIGIAVADIDGDRDADVMVLKAAPPHDIFLNGRVWQYRRDEHAAVLAGAPASAMLAGDLDADGETELYTTGSEGTKRWRRVRGGAWQPESLAAFAPATRLAIADTDGDGVLELLTGSRAVAQLDTATGPSQIDIGDDGVPMIWKPGPGRWPYLGLRLSGRDPKSDQRRSNVSGIGARVALRTASQWTAFDTTRLESGPGQSAQPTTIGLGGSPRADFIEITWSDGVFQTELALDSGKLHHITETQRQLSSCPVLFAWDGQRFGFVTDMLGVGGIGFFEKPGVYSPPFPRENVLLPAALSPSDGAYRLKLAEPMEEVTYLDQAAMVAYDLPPGWRMALDERKAVAGPEPTGAPLFYREEQRVAHAVNDAGEDVTERLAEVDHVAVGPAAVDPRFIGLARPYSVTLTFDRPIARGPGRPVLLIDGWVEYPYAQTVFAAWQAGAAYEAPTLEARDQQGRWHEVAREFGYPAGMPRQMAFPLPSLPPGATALRLHTSQEIYWDRVSVVSAEPLPNAQRRVLALRSAQLEAGGFARRTTGPQRAPRYDDSARTPLGDTRHPRGWYTEFGKVAPLIADADDAVAVFGPGEEITFEFGAPREPIPTGWTRRLVLESRGWCKDMDLYTQEGETVEPLPGNETAARTRLHRLFNTRYASGF